MDTDAVTMIFKSLDLAAQAGLIESAQLDAAAAEVLAAVARLAEDAGIDFVDALALAAKAAQVNRGALTIDLAEVLSAVAGLVIPFPFKGVGVAARRGVAFTRTHVVRADLTAAGD